MLSRSAALLAPAALAVALVGCNRQTTHNFPAGLEPLADNEAPWPSSLDSDELRVVVGESEADGGFSYAHGRGYIQADLEEVFAASEEWEAFVDRREVAAWTITWDTEPEYEVSYTIHNQVEDLIDFEYDVGWRHGPIEADEDGVVFHYGSRWQLTAVTGIQVFDLMRGSIQLIDLGDGVVGVEYVEELRSIQRAQDPDRAKNYIQDRFADLHAVVAGRALPDL